MIVDSNGMPIIKKDELDLLNIYNVQLTNYKNFKSVKERKNTILSLFNYDEELEKFWNDLLKYRSKFDGFLGVLAPDFSIHPNMNKLQIHMNTYKGHYIASFWQAMGLNVYGVPSWAYPDTYDICLSGYEQSGTFSISTIGVNDNRKIFLDGYNEMKNRLKPKLIILLGPIIEGMKGEFLHFDLEDTFNQVVIERKNRQLSFWNKPKHIIIDNNGTRYDWELMDRDIKG